MAQSIGYGSVTFSHKCMKCSRIENYVPESAWQEVERSGYCYQCRRQVGEIQLTTKEQLDDALTQLDQQIQYEKRCIKRNYDLIKSLAAQQCTQNEEGVRVLSIVWQAREIAKSKREICNIELAKEILKCVDVKDGE